MEILIISLVVLGVLLPAFGWLKLGHWLDARHHKKMITRGYKARVVDGHTMWIQSDTEEMANVIAEVLNSGKPVVASWSEDGHFEMHHLEEAPLLGIALVYKHPGKQSPRPNGASIDRIDTTLGYVRGNVWIISRKANVMKSDATLEELETFVKNVKEKILK